MEKMKVAKESKVKTLVYMAELTYCTTVISI
jgi:hypothetical protein